MNFLEFHAVAPKPPQAVLVVRNPLLGQTGEYPYPSLEMANRAAFEAKLYDEENELLVEVVRVH